MDPRDHLRHSQVSNTHTLRSWLPMELTFWWGGRQLTNTQSISENDQVWQGQYGRTHEGSGYWKWSHQGNPREAHSRQRKRQVQRPRALINSLHTDTLLHITHVSFLSRMNRHSRTLDTCAQSEQRGQGTGKGHPPHPWPGFSDVPGSEPSPSHTTCCFQPETWNLPRRGCHWSQLLGQTSTVRHSQAQGYPSWEEAASWQVVLADGRKSWQGEWKWPHFPLGLGPWASQKIHVPSGQCEPGTRGMEVMRTLALAGGGQESQ